MGEGKHLIEKEVTENVHGAAISPLVCWQLCFLHCLRSTPKIGAVSCS
jgi:hypothetical protein